MTDSPKYAPCEIVMAFGDDDYLFRFTVKQIAELQEKCKAGIGTIYRRVAMGEYYAEDLTESVRLGLIGGGVEATKARVLIERYLDPIPMLNRLEYAQAILAACVVGYEPPEDQKKKDLTAEMDGSTLPTPLETELSSESDQEKPVI